MISETDYAYLAGLIDGDGCILVRRRDHLATLSDRQRGQSYDSQVRIGGETTHLTLLRELHQNTGTIYVRKREGQRHLAEWTLSGQKGVRLLERITPYLKLKKRQGELLLSLPWPKSRWAATPEVRAEQERIRLEIKKANQLGRGKEKQNGY